MVDIKSQDITEDEATLYDRQIRLWGLESQKRLRAARILLIGLQGLGAEISKNIILAGVKSVVLMDHNNVTQDLYSSQFLVPPDNIGENIAESSLQRAQQLNPMVEVYSNAGNVDDEPDSFFTSYDVICATQCTLPQIVRLNQICRLNGIKFFASDVFGFFGYMFADLQLHEYSQEVKLPHKEKVSKDAQQLTMTKKATATFVPFQDILDVDWTSDEQAKDLKKMGNGYFIMRVLQAFREKEGHNPTRDKAALLKSIRDSVLEKLGVDAARVPDHSLEYVLYCIFFF
ncbi:hypothetical protein B566_EDAN008373 [Ephemera danica]|nr:hypothetical protein B566_EDAN008373 [Ephemera danica]